MSEVFEMNKSYRLTEAAKNEYLSTSSNVNKLIAERVECMPWTVHTLTEHGNVKSIKLESTGEILNADMLGFSNCIMFTKYELRSGMVEVNDDGSAQYIIVGGKKESEFGIVRGDYNSNLFTLEKAKKYVTKVIKHDPEYKFQIFKLNSTARAEKQEINVVFE